jgi:hypothetical protein
MFSWQARGLAFIDLADGWWQLRMRAVVIFYRNFAFSFPFPGSNPGTSDAYPRSFRILFTTFSKFMMKMDFGY